MEHGSTRGELPTHQLSTMSKHKSDKNKIPFYETQLCMSFSHGLPRLLYKMASFGLLIFLITKFPDYSSTQCHRGILDGQLQRVANVPQ
jgi:hypothetical protein